MGSIGRRISAASSTVSGGKDSERAAPSGVLWGAGEVDDGDLEGDIIAAEALERSIAIRLLSSG